MAYKMLLHILMIFYITLSLMPTSTKALPFVVFHGIADGCNNGGVRHFVESLRNWSGAQGYCVEIGNGARDSWFMPFLEQTNIACEKVKKMSELREGYNIVGLSQGNLIGRGVIEFCDDAPPVKNFISLAGPQAGEASVPFCGSGLLCVLVDVILKLAIYSNYVQEHLAPAGYVKIPTDISGYMKGCKFLTKLNNEIQGHRNSTYKERFSSLHNLVLIMFEQDKVLVPKYTAWFGYYEDGSMSTILPPRQTKLYIEDWIGLRSLDEAGRVKFVNVSGKHLDISTRDIQKYVLPYLKDENTYSHSTTTGAETPIRIKPSSAWGFIKNMFGIHRKWEELKMKAPK